MEQPLTISLLIGYTFFQSAQRSYRKFNRSIKLMKICLCIFLLFYLLFFDYQLFSFTISSQLSLYFSHLTIIKSDLNPKTQNCKLMDIDSANFDSKRYVLNMIKQNTIKQLIRKNNQVDEEIKVHDHQIQSLVFQNYSKFISSIDTVRQMKDNICMVDDKLKILQTSMDKIQELALKIDSTFSVKRKEIQKLDTINKDLQKLKNLCDFPNILKQDITFYKSLPQNKVSSDIEKLFNKSISAYQSCYKTLKQLKQEPLIAPIYKQSLDKVESIRSVLKALQVQFKGKVHCSILRNITRKLLVITDDQVSILRIYFHSWKQRLGQTCFKGPRKITSELSQPENNKYLMNQIVNAQIPQINEELWRQFVEEFRFIYKDIYPKLTISPEEIQLHINNHMKEIFLWGLNNYIDAAPMYCASLKAYVHVTHIITNKIIEALDFMKMSKDHHSAKDQNKTYLQLKQKMEEKLEALGIGMFNYTFGKLKIYFILEIIQSKKQCQTISTNQQAIKQSQIKVLNPLKDTLTSNFRIILDELEHFKNIYELVFKSKVRYEEVIHKKIEELIHFLSQIISLPSTFLSQNVNTLINPNFGNKINKIQKGIIQSVTKDLRESSQSGTWFFVVHHFLTLLNNVLGKRIIESAQKNVQIPKNHDYGKVFNGSKLCISKNLLSYANYFSNLTTNCSSFSQMLEHIQSFMILLNLIFHESKRNIIKKPSFLTEENSFAYETQILTAKKLHLIQKKNPQQRNSILTYFIRKVIKQVLINVRQKRNCKYSQNDVYNLIQICYELSNVQEESQICAFFYFIKGNWPHQWKLSREQMETKYLEIRKNFSL